MLFYHLPSPARSVESLKKVIVSLVYELLSVNISLCNDWLSSDLGVGGIGNVVQEIIDLEYEIGLPLGAEFPGGDLCCML